MLPSKRAEVRQAVIDIPSSDVWSSISSPLNNILSGLVCGSLYTMVWDSVNNKVSSELWHFDRELIYDN